jgi:hypothetical protein
MSIVLESDKSWFRLYFKTGSLQLKWKDIEATVHVAKEGYYLVRIEHSNDKDSISVRPE